MGKTANKEKKGKKKKEEKVKYTWCVLIPTSQSLGNPFLGVQTLPQNLNKKKHHSWAPKKNLNFFY